MQSDINIILFEQTRHTRLTPQHTQKIVKHKNIVSMLLWTQVSQLLFVWIAIVMDRRHSSASNVRVFFIFYVFPNTFWRKKQLSQYLYHFSLVSNWPPIFLASILELQVLRFVSSTPPAEMSASRISKCVSQGIPFTWLTIDMLTKSYLTWAIN